MREPQFSMMNIVGENGVEMEWSILFKACGLDLISNSLEWNEGMKIMNICSNLSLKYKYKFHFNPSTEHNLSDFGNGGQLFTLLLSDNPVFRWGLFELF